MPCYKVWCDPHSLRKIFKKGQRKMDEELDLVQIVKKIRKFESILNASLLNDENRKLMVEHTEPNIIDISNEKGKDHIDLKYDNSQIDQALCQQVLYRDTFQKSVLFENEKVSKSVQVTNKRYDP